MTELLQGHFDVFFAQMVSTNISAICSYLSYVQNSFKIFTLLERVLRPSGSHTLCAFYKLSDTNATIWKLPILFNVELALGRFASACPSSSSSSGYPTKTHPGQVSQRLAVSLDRAIFPALLSLRKKCFKM